MHGFHVYSISILLQISNLYAKAKSDVNCAHNIIDIAC